MTTNFDPFDYPRGRIPAFYRVKNVVILFDVVGFTKLTVYEMQKTVECIDNVIKELLGEECKFRWNEKRHNNDLILIPTGDGYGIGFNPITNNEKIVYIAAELMKRLSIGNNINIRMGISKGNNIRYWDMNDNANLIGDGINMAARVMSLALENQVLIHQNYIKEIPNNGKYSIVEVPDALIIKHNKIIKVYNLFKDGEFGNPTMPKRMQYVMELLSSM